MLSIELLSLCQAIDFLNIENRLSSQTRKAYLEIMNLVPRFEDDTAKYIEIKRINDYLCTHFIHGSKD